MKSKTLVVISLFILMVTMTVQFPVSPATSGTAEPGSQLNLHAVNPLTGKGVLIDLYNPADTIWHELWPVFCNKYFLWSWKDGQVSPLQPGYGKLSPCDKVDLMNVNDPDNPVFVGFFHVEQVMVTLLVSNLTNDSGMAHPAFIESELDIQEFPWEDPVSTQWHEKWPVYSTRYHLTVWMDQVPDGKLGPGDVVKLTFKVDGEPVGPIETYIVAEVATDMLVTAMPAPDFLTVGGKVDSRLYLYVQNYLPNCRIPFGGVALPMVAPFMNRFIERTALSPMSLIQEICFLPPVDVDTNGVPDIIPIEKVQINPIVHYVWVPPPARPPPGAWWRFTLVAPAPGEGLIFINPAMPGDVDCYTNNNDTGVYWAAPSQMAGQKAAESGGHYNMLTGDFVPSFESRFPSGGADGIPGTRLWMDPLEGFGNGVPDPVGSSILMLPLVLMGDEWNGTAWVATMAVPMPLILTTGTAYDHVVSLDPTPTNPPGKCFLYCMNSTEVGKPWDAARTTVTYVCAWSNLLYALNPDDDGDGIPDPDAAGMYYTTDLFYEYVEKKKRIDVAIADLNGDGEVDIFDMVMVGIAYGSRDEGLGKDGLPLTADDKYAADRNFNPRADLNGDGFIDIFDVTRCALDFGKKDP